jgi:hypothetical protein
MTMWLTDLADAARSSGLPVQEVPGWETTGHGPMSGVRAVICHHTAGPATGDMPSLSVVEAGRADLPGPLANLTLSRSGVVYVVAAGCAWHAGAVFSPDTQGNPWSIGIEAEATGVDPWSAVQYAAYARLCAALIRHYGLSFDRVLGHKEVASPAGRKTDPNFDMQEFRAAVAAGGGPTVQWNDKAIPDYASGAKPVPLLQADVTFGWLAKNAADAASTAHRVEGKVDALAARPAIQVDYALLADAIVAALLNRVKES